MIRIKHRSSGKVLLRVNAATLEGVDLSQAPLRGADLSGADLSGADLRGADLRRADLGGPGWTLGKEIARTGLIWVGVAVLFSQVLAVLQWLVWQYTPPSLHWLVPLLNPIAWFFATTLVCMVWVIQALGRWWKAIWAPTNLRGANLRGADLRGTALAGAKWDGAVYDGATSWPKGFDPAQHGAVMR